MRKLNGIILAALLLTGPWGFAQNRGVVDISVCNLRDRAQFTAEMVSQALLGTPVHILETDPDNSWPLVQTPDGYTGWVHRDAITRLSADDYSAWNAAHKLVITAFETTVRQEPSRKGEALSDAVAGDRLVLEGRRGAFYKVRFPDGRIGWVSRRDACPLERWRSGLDNSAGAIISTALSFLGRPYIWAGMSPKGMDCSGYVRSVLFLHDIIIPRDAGPMAATSERINSIDELNPGDLVFFGRWASAGVPKVSHVGFYLGEGRFIHCLGLVKIGSLDPSSPEYDAYNAGRYLFGGRFLQLIDKAEGYTTTGTNPYYSE